MKALLLAASLLLLSSAPAFAEDANHVAAALRSTPVYQSAGLDLVDVATLTSELTGSDPRVDVAVLPASAAGSADEARARAIEIGKALGDRDAVVLVITANQHLGAAQGGEAADRGVDARGALRAELEAAKDDPFDKDHLTAFVLSFAQRIADQAGSSQGSAPGDLTGDNQRGQRSNSHAGLWIGALALAGLGGTALVVRSSRTRRKRLNEGLRAEVEQLYERLGADVLGMATGDNAVATQAMADASERYSACGSQLAQADSPPEFAAARRTAVEGLSAARKAREALGIDPGPEIPLLPGTGPQLATEQKVTVGGQEYDGSPTYQPGRPNYWGGGTIGGQHVPGGWYSGNFWDTFLLGSILTGGFGGGLGGGGFERGYEAGREDSQGGGGDWSGGSGGDSGWSGGGGDWGGGSGGGDSGGSGGGDW